MKIKVTLLVLILMFLGVSTAMAQSGYTWEDPGDPGLFLTGTTAIGGVVNNGTSNTGTLAGFPRDTVEPSITFGSSANVTYFTNTTGAPITQLYIVAPELTGATIISDYGCGTTVGVPPTYFSSCTSFFEGSDVVFEYYNGSIPVGDTFGVLGDSIWSADDYEVALSVPEPGSLTLLWTMLLGSGVLLRRKLRN